MSVKDSLPPVLRGEIGTRLTPADREQLESIGETAATDRQLPLLRDECAARLKQPGASFAVEYLLAIACALNGEVERAHQTLLALGDRLAGQKLWEPLAAVAERALSLEETQAAAHLLVRAHEGLAQEPARIEAFGRAWTLLHDDLEFGLLFAVRLGEAGEGDQRRALLAELLARFAVEARYAGLEEAALEFVESADVSGLVRVIEALPIVAEQGAVRECIQLADIAFPVIARSDRAGEVVAPLRATAAKAAEKDPGAPESFRAALVESLRQGPGRELPEPDVVFQTSGVDDRMKPILAALDRFDAIAALPPGRAVHHSSFGAGRVTFDDGEAVMLDFAHSRGHRMPYAAARRSLTPIAEDDLRLLSAHRPDELKRLRADDPAQIIRRALSAMGGSADAQRLKVFLVGSQLVPAADWTSFWRKAKAAVDKDPAIDSARAFEQHYRLAPARKPTDVAAVPPLPALEPRKPVKTNLSTMRKFLAQHPAAETALAARFGRFVTRAVLDPEGDRVDRARGGLFFARWFPDRAAEWTVVLQLLWEQGLSISDLSGEDEQLALLEASHAAGIEADAILSALDSRFSAVRAAAALFRQRLDDRGREEMRRTLLLHGPRYPAAALRLIEQEIDRKPPPSDAWLVFAAALSLIEERPKPSVADKVLGWLEQGGAIDRMLSGTPSPEDQRLRLRVLLRQWRSSDRYLFPALDAAERLGLVEEAGAVQAARQQKSEKLFDRMGQQAEDTDLAVMTRATWERQRKELERLERELRTTIPASIQKARELGDLRENAEYHSAKLKQANVSRIVASLQKRLTRARFVDDVEHRDGTVGLGTEVVLESDTDVVTYWILGEEEHHHGAHVVSFQAPVGRALMGRSIGDEVELGENDLRRTYRVVSIERRLPPTETEVPT